MVKAVDHAALVRRAHKLYEEIEVVWRDLPNTASPEIKAAVITAHATVITALTVAKTAHDNDQKK